MWDRVRRPTLVQWRKSNSWGYNWMSPGRGAARAIWAQSVEEEAAGFEGKKSAAVLVDLVKAFEQVTLGPIWKAGIQTHFHPHMLRLALELRTAERRLVYKKAASQSTVKTLTAILAGLGVASDLMLIKLMKLVDAMVAKYQTFNVYVIADDVKWGSTARMKTGCPGEWRRQPMS